MDFFKNHFLHFEPVCIEQQWNHAMSEHPIRVMILEKSFMFRSRFMFVSSQRIPDDEV